MGIQGYEYNVTNNKFENRMIAATQMLDGRWALEVNANIAIPPVEVDIQGAGATGDNIRLVDEAGNKVNVDAATNALQVFIANTIPLEVNLDPANDGVYLADKADNVVAVTANALDVNVTDDETLPTAAFNGEDTIAVTETALNGGAPQAVTRGLTLQADATNTESLFVGVTGVTVGNGVELTAGESFPIEIDDVAKVFAICASGGQSARWFGS